MSQAIGGKLLRGAMTIAHYLHERRYCIFGEFPHLDQPHARECSGKHRRGYSGAGRAGLYRGENGCPGPLALTGSVGRRSVCS